MTSTPLQAIERRAFGTLRLRGSIWWLRYKINGKVYEESSGKTDKRKAEKVLARREAELGLGHFIAPNVKRTTVDDLAQMLRDDYRVTVGGHSDGPRRASRTSWGILGARGR